MNLSITRLHFRSPLIRLFAVCLVLCAAGGCRRAGDEGSGRPAVKINVQQDHGQQRSVQKDRHSRERGSGKVSESADRSKPADSPHADDSGSTEPRLIVSGRVTGPDGSPLPDVRVRLLQLSFEDPIPVEHAVGETTSTADGRYAISVADSRQVKVQATCPGFVTMTRTLYNLDAMRPGAERSIGTRRVTQNITLPAASHLRGRVVDEADKPVGGVAVSAFVWNPAAGTDSVVPDRAMTTTTAAGEFALEDVPSENLTLNAESSAHVPYTGFVDAPAENVEIRLSGAGSEIQGNVFLKSSGRAVSSATVELVRLTDEDSKLRFYFRRVRETTDEAGEFRFTRLPAGRYNLYATKGGLHPIQTQAQPGYTVQIGDKETTTGITFYLYPGHTVSGVVLDKDTSEPLTGAVIKVVNSRQPSPPDSESGADGTFSITNILPEHYPLWLTAARKGYFLEKALLTDMGIAVTLSPDKLEKQVTLRMARTVTVSGAVIDSRGDAVPDAVVSLFNSGYSTSIDKPIAVDRAGRFELDVEPFTPVRVRATSPAFPAAFSDIADVQDESLTGINVTLRQSAFVSGVVVDPENRPVENASVKAYQTIWIKGSGRHEEIGTLTTDSSGRFVFPRVPATAPPDGKPTPVPAYNWETLDVRLGAEKKGFANSKTENLSLLPGGEERNLTLRLQKSCYLAGKITNAEGDPFPGVAVYANSPDGNGKQVSTDTEGRYRLEDLPDAPHNLNLFHSEFSEYHQNVAVNRNDADFVLGKAKKSSTMTGIVVDAKTGNPIADFEVTGFRSVQKDVSTPGKFIAKNLQQGNSYTFTITAEGSVASFQTIQAPAGETEFEKTFPMGAGGTVAGRVLEKGSDKPLVGVKVITNGTRPDNYSANIRPLASAVTGEDGRFELKSLPAGSNMITVRPAPPLASIVRRVQVEHEQTTDMGDIYAGGGASVVVKVVRQPGNVPVPDTKVDLNCYSGQRATFTGKTDANGIREFTGLVSGSTQNYIVQASDLGLQTNFTLQEDERREITLQTGAGSLTGKVIQSGKPLKASLYLTHMTNGSGVNRSAQTQDDGTFRIAGLAPGVWSARISLTQNYAVQMHAWVDIQGETERVFEFPTSRIVGRVLDASDKPLVGVRVSASPNSPGSSGMTYAPVETRDVQSGQEGHFTIEGIAAGIYSVTATKGDLSAFVTGVVVPADGDSPSVVLKMGVTQTGSLYSVTLNLTDGTPHSSAWCWVRSEAGLFSDESRRQPDGTMRIPGIPPGNYTAMVGAPGFSTAEHLVTIEAGKETRIDDVLYPAGSMQWILKTAAGAPKAGVQCRLTPDDASSIEKPREGMTDANGIWMVRGLAPGNYTAAVTGGAPTAKVSIRVGENAVETTVVE